LRSYKEGFKEDIVVTLTVSDEWYQLESVVRKGRWFQNDEDPDDNVDEDGPLELPSRKFNHIEAGVNYFG
jgi:hypothetical protein